jgi:hypothetical protein
MLGDNFFLISYNSFICCLEAEQLLMLMSALNPCALGLTSLEIPVKLRRSISPSSIKRLLTFPAPLSSVSHYFCHPLATRLTLFSNCEIYVIKESIPAHRFHDDLICGHIRQQRNEFFGSI